MQLFSVKPDGRYTNHQPL